LIAAGGPRWSSFRPLRHRNFALVWSAALVSNVGSWMQTVAVGTLVTELTGRASGAGFIAAAGFLPIGILSPFGGAIADRVDRRRFLILTTLGETSAAVALAVVHATGHATPLTVAAPVFAGGAIAALGFPCYQAMLPDLVGEDDLLGAVSLSSAQFNLGRVIGPALAGLAIHFGSYTWAFAANALSFGAVVAALAAVRVGSPRAGPGARVLAQIRDGVRAAREEPGCRQALRVAFVMALCASPFIAMVPAFAVVVFGGDAGTTSLLVTAQGLGAVAGALAMTPLAARIGRDRALAVNLALLPVTLAVYAGAPAVPWAAMALVLVGATYIGVFSGLNTLIQLRAPAAYRGRILSLYFVVVGVMYPIGAAVQGRIADWAGLRLTTAGGAAAMLGFVALARPSLRFGASDATAAADTPADGAPRGR
jgi:MFS family permease